MGTYIDLDSTHRIFADYNNSASYTVRHEQVSSWNKAPRQVSAHSARPGSRVVEFSQSVQCKHVILPYVAITYVDSSGTVQNTHTADLQRLYLDVHTARYNDTQLINTIDNKVSRARFVLTQEGVQGDNSGFPKWVKFGCRMDQVMRFARDESIVVDIMQEDGFTIIIDDVALPAAVTKAFQTYILLEVVPYFRDGDYDNHALGLTQH